MIMCHYDHDKRERTGGTTAATVPPVRSLFILF